MQRVAALPPVVAAPRGLSINRDDVGVIVAQAADPAQEAGLEQLRVKCCEHVAQRIVARDAAFVAVEAPEERQMLRPPTASSRRSRPPRRWSQTTPEAGFPGVDTILWHADVDREGRRSDPTERCRLGSPSGASFDEAPYELDFQPRRKLPPALQAIALGATTHRAIAAALNARGSVPHGVGSGTTALCETCWPAHELWAFLTAENCDKATHAHPRLDYLVQR